MDWKLLLISNWQTILVLFVLIVVIPLFFVITKQWIKLRKYALNMIHIAEVSIKGSNMGEQKFNYVLDALYAIMIPDWLKKFLPKSLVAKQLQIWFDEIKKLLDYKPPEPNASENIDKPPDEKSASLDA